MLVYRTLKNACRQGSVKVAEVLHAWRAMQSVTALRPACSCPQCRGFAALAASCEDGVARSRIAGETRFRKPTRVPQDAQAKSLPGDCVLFFGRFKGKTLRQIAGEEGGVKYLDWLVTEDWLHGYVKRSLVKFLTTVAGVVQQQRELLDRYKGDGEPEYLWQRRSSRLRNPNPDPIDVEKSLENDAYRVLRNAYVVGEDAAGKKFRYLPKHLWAWQKFLKLHDNIEACGDPENLKDLGLKVAYLLDRFEMPKQLVDDVRSSYRRRVFEITNAEEIKLRRQLVEILDAAANAKHVGKVRRERELAEAKAYRREQRLLKRGRRNGWWVRRTEESVREAILFAGRQARNEDELRQMKQNRQ